MLLGILLLMPNSVSAQDARLKDIIVTNTRDDLLVYLTVEGAFTEKMKKAVLSGVTTTFSFFISLVRVIHVTTICRPASAHLFKFHHHFLLDETICHRIISF